jgi:AI-2 transport protein TqsA
MVTSKTRISSLLLTVASFVVVVAGMKAAAPLITQILLAIFIVVLTAPLLFMLQRIGISTWLSLLLIVLGLVLIGTLLTSVLIASLNDFARNLPQYQASLQEQFGGLLNSIEARGVELPEAGLRELLLGKNAFALLGNTVTALTGVLSKGFLILLITIFMLAEAAILPAKIRAMPGLSDETFGRLALIVGNLRHYFGMKTLMSLLTGALVSAFCFFNGIDYAILLGVLAFLLNFIPNIGSFIAGIPGVMLALVQFGFGRAVFVGIGYFIINTAVSNFLEPRVMGRGLGLSPMIIIVSLFIWSWVLGPVGMLLSVPLTMIIKVALESNEESRGLAILLGSAAPKSAEDAPGAGAAPGAP